MSVRYRPICPQQAWRSQLAHSLTSVERFGELYLLTNPAANAIGCYPLIPRIAAAEIGMSADEMQNVISRLEEMSVAILRDGHILVRTWFLHSTWESTLTGNVLKTALADIRRMPPQLQVHWRDACVAAGAPAQLVDDCMAKALQSPCQGATKGPTHTNETEPSTTSDTTTTSTNDSHSESALWLSSSAEAHRQTLLRVARENNLTQAQMQELGYELSARIDAASQGAGKSIGVASRWLSTLAQAQRQGHGHTFTLRLHLSAPIDEVMGWTVDFGDVKQMFDPIFKSLDHHPIHLIEDGPPDGHTAAIASWIKNKAISDLPALARVDLYETEGCGSIVTTESVFPALPV